jgi:hypothetical protein
MKIDGTKSSSDINKKKDVKKTSSGDGAFKSMMDGGAGAAKSTSGAGLSSGIASVDALLAAQTMEDSTQKQAKKRMQDRAEDILDKLQDLKVAMVTGEITVGHMVSIADVVATHRDKINDPNLSAILDEIDLRAHVELAKLQVASKR